MRDVPELLFRERGLDPPAMVYGTRLEIAAQQLTIRSPIHELERSIIKLDGRGRQGKVNEG